MPSGILATSLSATSKILLLVGAGVLMERKGILTADGRAIFNRVVCSAMLPALLFVTTVLPLGAPLLNLAPLILSCLGTIASGNALGRMFSRLMPTEASRKATVLACTCSNAGAVPMLLLTSLCTDKSSALHGSSGCETPEGYPGLFSIPMNILYWTWAVSYMKNDGAVAEVSQSADPAAEAPTGSSTQLSKATCHVARGMKRSRSDVFEMVDGHLVPTIPEHVDSLAEPVVLASSTLPMGTMSTTNSPRPTTTPGHHQAPILPPPLVTSNATGPAELARLSSAAGSARAPHGTRTSWGSSFRQKLAQRLLQGTQYTLVPVMDDEESTMVATIDSPEPSRLWKCAMHFGSLASMPPNAAILLALLIGLSPLRGLLVISSDVAARGESAPLGVLFDTLGTLGAGANPSLMLLLGASLSDTAQSARVASADYQPERNTASAPDIRRSCCDDDGPPGLEGAKRGSCAVFLVRWVLIPAIHVLALWLLSWSGLFSSLETDLVQRFVILAEGAVPASMTVLAIAVQQGNQDVERQLGIVLLSQYGLSAFTLTASTSLFLSLL
eukprot:COSAG02_NODE_1385_length_12954_cov_3.484250_9_plen_557_part_00